MNLEFAKEKTTAKQGARIEELTTRDQGRAGIEQGIAAEDGATVEKHRRMDLPPYFIDVS
jgi:hypothetical protein